MIRLYMKSSRLCVMMLFTLYSYVSVWGTKSRFHDFCRETILSDGIAYSFHRDSIGFLWVGMQGMLVRVDGPHAVHYPLPGSKESIKRPNSIVDLDNRTLLLGGDFGLVLFNKSLGVFENVFSKDENHQVYALAALPGGGAIAGGMNGLTMISSALKLSSVIYDNKQTILKGVVYDIAIAGQSIWLTTDTGIYRAPFGKGKIGNFELVWSGEGDCFSKMWVQSEKVFLYNHGGKNFEHGLYLFDTTKGEFTLCSSLGNKSVSAITANDSCLFVSTDGDGLSVFNVITGSLVNHLTVSSVPLCLRSNALYSVLMDMGGNLWLGYYQDGVDILYSQQSTLFTQYALNDIFQTKGLFIRTVDYGDKECLLATREDVYYINEKKREFQTIPKSRLGNSQPIEILKYRDGYVIGTFGGGLYMFYPATGILESFGSEPYLKVSSMAIDSNDNLWVVSDKSLQVYNAQTLEREFTEKNSILPSGLRRIFFDSQGRGWITSQSKMLLYDSKTDRLRDDIFPKGFINKEFVRMISEDRLGNLYFCYDRNKIFKSDAWLSRFGRLEHNLPIDDRDINVMQLLSDSLWIIGTSNGLYATKDFNEYFKFGQKDGVIRAMINPDFSFDSINNTLYLPTSDGLLVTDVKKIVDVSQREVGLVLTDICYNGERIVKVLPEQRGREINLAVPSHTSTIDLYFTDFSFSQEKMAELEYKTEKSVKWKSIPITQPISLYYTDKFDSYVKVRVAGVPSSEIKVKIDEEDSVLLLIFFGVFLFGGIVWLVVRCRWFTGRGKLVISFLFPRSFKSGNNDRLDDMDNQCDKDTRDNSVVELVNEKVDMKSESQKYRNLNISVEELRSLSVKIDELMNNEQLYKNPSLKIGYVSERLEVSSTVLSYLFSHYLNTNYYRYLNSFRIRAFKELVAEGTGNIYTLSAMAEMCGFSSRTSFFRHFKEVEGCSPLEYIKTVENQKN